MKRIILWADEYDYEVWKTYCDILGVPAHALNIACMVASVEPTFEEDDEVEDE